MTASTHRKVPFEWVRPVLPGEEQLALGYSCRPAADTDDLVHSSRRCSRPRRDPRTGTRSRRSAATARPVRSSLRAPGLIRPPEWWEVLTVHGAAAGSCCRSSTTGAHATVWARRRSITWGRRAGPPQRRHRTAAPPTGHPHAGEPRRLAGLLRLAREHCPDDPPHRPGELDPAAGLGPSDRAGRGRAEC
jgi:hypothetical protein